MIHGNAQQGKFSGPEKVSRVLPAQNPRHLCRPLICDVRHVKPRMMFRRFSVFWILAIAFGVVSTAAAKEPRVNGDRLVFELPDIEGNIVRSSDAAFAGKVLYVTLWGTWCPPCVSEVPTLNELQARYSSQGLVVVAIAFEKADDPASRRETLGKFAELHGIRYLILDGGATFEFSAALPMVEDVKGLPVELLIDRSGMVALCRNSDGYKKRWARRLEDRLRALLDAESGVESR